MAQFDELIVNKILQYESEGKELHPNFITHEICSEQISGLARGERSEFWRHFGYKAVRTDVGSFLANRYKPKSEKNDDQLVLGGLEFNYVQRYYVVKRGGDEIAVPTENLQPKELLGIAIRLEKAGRSCLEHAKELRRFLALKRSENAAQR